jgi:hypothetical protein
MSSSRRRVSPVAVAIAVGLGAAATGCNLVVSSGDYVVGNVDGGSAASPDGSQPPADGGEPGSDASDRPDGSAPGEGGVLPEGGSTGDGGPAAACGAGGVLVPGGLPTGDARFQQIVNACVLAVSCDPFFFDTTVSDCITRDYLDAVYPDGCLAGITSCAGYYGCTGTRIATTTECPESLVTDTGTCSASGVATSCTVNLDGTVFGSISNCGASCTVYDEDAEDTASGCEITTGCDASGDPTLTCTSNNGLYVCEATETDATIGLGSMCPIGSTCQTSNGFTDCYYTQPTCTTPGSKCAGGDLITCATIGTTNQQYTSSCSATGLECTPNADGTASCAAPGCANSGCTEQCNGSQLELCIGGAPYPVDCTSPALGFDTCASGTFNDLNYNYCAYQ